MTLWNNTLVIGATTDGIGKDFVSSLVKDEGNQKCWTPGPENLDVRYPTSIENFLNDHKLFGGPFEAVLYCAAVKELDYLKQQNINSIKKQFDVNVFGFLNVLKGLMDHQKSGRMCVITSEAAVTPMRTTLAYCASKAALEMAIKCAARELAPDWMITGIRPTVIDETPITDDDIVNISGLRHWTEGDVREAFKDNPLHRMVRKREVSDVARWLLYQAPQAMTGSIVEVRCGK